MQEILKAIHINLCEINVKGQDVFRMASAIQMLEQVIEMTNQTEIIDEEMATE